MNSMTGFGRGEFSSPVGSLVVEISSVNNRFLEISTRLPRPFFNLEPKVRQLVSSRLNRGKISLYVGYEESENLPGKYEINKKAAAAYFRQLQSLQKELGVHEEISLSTILGLPDVTRPEGGLGANDDRIWSAVEQVVSGALDKLVLMREKEGKALAKDMKARLTVLSREIKSIRKVARASIETYRQKISQRLKELLEKPPDNQRLEEEIAIMAERTDITEECTRFESHLEQFKSALEQSEPVGKKLNFILQELNREANTISSKSVDISVSSNIILMKEEIEKLREQVQNIE